MSFALDPTSAVSTLGQWLYDWQTLLSGFLALGAATWAAVLLNKQIKLSEALPEIERGRRFLAARCLMPIQLTAILGYCETAAQALINFKQVNRETTDETIDLRSSLVFPHETVNELTKIIELSADKCLIAILAKIISKSQVLTSRMSAVQSSDRVSFGTSPSNVEIYIFQAAKIQSLASSLYEFARQETDTIPKQIDWAGVVTTLHIWNVYEEHFPQLWAFVERKRASGSMFDCSH